MRTLESGNRLKPLVRCEPPEGRRPVLGGDGGGPVGQLELDLPMIITGDAARSRIARPGPGLGTREVRALLTAILEVRDGTRAASQVRELLHPRVYQRLAGGSRPLGVRHTLKSVHASKPVPGVLEAFGTVVGGGRPIAFAARFEYTRRGWRCTAFDLLIRSRR